MNQMRERIQKAKLISLRNILERDGHRVLRVSGIFRLCCPFHREKTPSCFLYDDNRLYCFGCGTHADTIDYISRRDSVDFKTALESLERDSGLSRMPRRIQSAPDRVEDDALPEQFFSERMDRWRADTHPEEIVMLGERLGVDGECLFSLDVAWAEEHKAWAIPMRNADDRIVGIRLRDNDGNKWAVKGSKQGLFIPRVQVGYDIVVTEGPTDCAAALSMGMFAVGKPMAMMASSEILRFISRNKARRVIVIADNDFAGLKGAAKLVDSCPVPTCELVLPTKDIREFANIGGSRSLLDSMLASQQWRRKVR